VAAPALSNSERLKSARWSTQTKNGGRPVRDYCRVNRRERRLVNIRYWADHAIEAMRVQVTRLDGGSENHRVDLDFYLIAAWRLMEQIRQAWVGYGVPGAEELWREFNDRFPYVDETRDWWIHATDRITNHSYFATDIMRATQPPTFVIRTRDLPELERIYQRFCQLLGPLPTDELSPLQPRS
jgi:hypothetical protein